MLNPNSSTKVSHVILGRFRGSLIDEMNAKLISINYDILLAAQRPNYLCSLCVHQQVIHVYIYVIHAIHIVVAVARQKSST